jgi:hypothetical protein
VRKIVQASPESAINKYKRIYISINNETYQAAAVHSGIHVNLNKYHKNNTLWLHEKPGMPFAIGKAT